MPEVFKKIILFLIVIFPDIFHHLKDILAEIIKTKFYFCCKVYKRIVFSKKR